MYADDDGFVNPRKIMRMLGSSEDDLKILLGKRFLLTFASGVVVVKHWKINNLVRKDWYRPTQYVEEKGLLLIKENGAYTDDLEGYSLVNEPLTQVRLGKVSIDNTYPSQAQDSEEKHETLDPELYPPAKQKKEALPSVSDVLAIWNRYPDWKATGKTSAPVNQTAIKKLLPPAKLTDDLTASIMKKRNKYSLTQIEEGVKAYVVEIANRPKDNYQSHRFSAYEFFTYPNGLIKYANR